MAPVTVVASVVVPVVVVAVTRFEEEGAALDGDAIAGEWKRVASEEAQRTE